MKVKCFDCSAIVEAGDAAAEERLSGGVVRLDEIGEIAVHPVTEGRVDDWLWFFDRDAFAGNLDWASCYCLVPHAPSTPEEPERPWRVSRAAACEHLFDRSTFGYLGFVDGRAVG